MHEGPRRKAGQGAPGPLELLHTWERPRPGRPRGAGGGLALGPWRRGGPGLAQRRRLQEARGFGLRRRRLLVLRPLRRPRSVREPAALRPAPSAAQAPAPAPTSTWSPIETVRHAPCSPPGAAAAAPNRTRGRRRGPPVTAAPHSGLMEEAGGPCSVLRAPGPRRRAAAQRPPPRLPPAYGRSPLSPASPAHPLARPRRSGAEAGHSGPPRPGGPGPGCPPAGWRRPLAFAGSWLGWLAS